MRKTNDGIHAYTERLKPQLRLFYRAAHAMTGSRQQAECVLSNALLNAFLQRGEWRERMSFREGVMRAVKEAAREYLKKNEKADRDWAGISADSEEGYPLAELLSGESDEVQRSMILRFGCAMTPKEIAFMTGRAAEQVREEIARFQTRAERELKKKNVIYKPFDRYAVKEIRQWMNRADSEPIDAGYFLSTFERDVEGAHRPRHIVSNIVKWLFIGAGSLILAAGVWLIAILMEM